LWKRHAVDLAEEVRWAGSKDKLLHTYRFKIRETANNERSIQNIQMRNLYLSKLNREWALCLRTIPGEEGGEKEPPIIPAALLESLAGETGEDQDPIQTLRSVIFSNEMYVNEELYRRWCEGLESCQLRGTFRKQRSCITRLISTAHEAHMRLEVR